MNALVVGGAGFIGSHLTDFLVNVCEKVYVIDNLSTGKKEYLNERAGFMLADISKIEPKKLGYFMNVQNINVIFMLAAKARVQPSIDNPIEYNETNVNGLLNVLESARISKTVKRVVYSSSSSIYGDQEILPFVEHMEPNPMSPYALQKLIGEQYCRLYSKLYGLETVSLRYFNVFGERQPTKGAYALVVGIFLDQMKKGLPLTITNDGEQRRSFTYVKDVVLANILAADSWKVGNGEIFNIGWDYNISVNEIAEIVGGKTKFIGERIEPKETLADINLAKSILGWKPTMKLEFWLENEKNRM